MNAIKTDKLTKIYKNTVAVEALTMAVSQGELFALLGVNGAGKTTTVKMLSCLTQPSGGGAWVHGHSIKTDTQAVKALVGVSPQETAVAPHLSVWENLTLMGGVHGFPKDKSRATAIALCEQLGLAAVRDNRPPSYPAAISGG